MLGRSDHVWVTSAVDEGEVEKALLLSFSLRRCNTTRKLSVVASSRLTPELRNALHCAFDLVFYLEEHMNTTCLNSGEFAKLYSIHALRSYKKCAYVSPSMMAIRNCDEIFEEKTSGIFLLDANTSVFVCEPGMNLFQLILHGIEKEGANNGLTGIGAFLEKWISNQVKDVGFLPAKYSVKITQDILFGNTEDVFMVSLEQFPEGLDTPSFGKLGMLGKAIAEYWRKIHEEDVLPLLPNYCEAKPSRTPISGQLFTRRHVKEPVAIVGMSCRYPGSNNLEEFWSLLLEGQDGTSSPPKFRWLNNQVQEARKRNAGFLKVPVDEFDASCT